MLRFETYERTTLFGRRRFYFRLVGANHEPIAYSEPYNSAEARDYGIELVKRSAAAPTVEA